jgi:hypothetical protein
MEDLLFFFQFDLVDGSWKRCDDLSVSKAYDWQLDVVCVRRVERLVVGVEARMFESVGIVSSDRRLHGTLVNLIAPVVFLDFVAKRAIRSASLLTSKRPWCIDDV